MLNNYPNKMLHGTEVKFNDKENNITPGIQRVFTDTSYNFAKTMNDIEKLVFRGISQKSDYYKQMLTKSPMSGRDRYRKNDLGNNVRRSLILDTKLKGKGIEKIVIPSNIIDVYCRLEVLLGPKLSGHTDTLTEASNLIDDL